MILNSRCAKIKINNTEIFTVFYYGTIEGLVCEFCSDLIIMERVFTMKSSVIKDGVSTAPQRSLLNALGLTEEEIKKPFIGIVSSKNDIVPGHMNIDKIVDAVKQGVALAGGVPIVFPAIAVCDGIAMGHEGMKYSLVTRELIADSTEAMAKAHAFDALVMVPNCDKNVPGMLMAAARINVPTVFVSGGPMLAGHVKGKKTSLSSMFEAVGAYTANKITAEELAEFENKACPSCGSCSGMYTANSMNCLTEAIGMGLQGNGTIPAVYSDRIKLAKHAGMKVMELLEKDIRPRDILTEKAFMNALTVDMALGCSTNTMLHLPAIAKEAGVKLNLDIANEISKKTPNLCHLAPAGHTYMEDLNEAGGVYAVMNELTKVGLLDTDLITATGKTVGENIKGCEIKDTDIIRPVTNPYSKTGGIAVLKGNLAPDGSVVKRSAVAEEMMHHKGAARVFDCEEDALSAIYDGKINPGEVVVIRYEGPKGGPGTGKTTTLNAIIKIMKANGKTVLLSAPTGRAAQRMSELTGDEAKTLHRLLEVSWDKHDNPVFNKNERNQLKCDALIVDEVSMVDTFIMESVMRALSTGCRLILVGDSDQLPSVGPGNVLGDLIESGLIPVVRLNEIFRQAQQSLIVTNAHKIVNGEIPILNSADKDFFFQR